MCLNYSASNGYNNQLLCASVSETVTGNDSDCGLFKLSSNVLLTGAELLTTEYGSPCPRTLHAPVNINSGGHNLDSSRSNGGMTSNSTHDSTHGTDTVVDSSDVLSSPLVVESLNHCNLQTGLNDSDSDTYSVAEPSVNNDLLHELNSDFVDVSINDSLSFECKNVSKDCDIVEMTLNKKFVDVVDSAEVNTHDTCQMRASLAKWSLELGSDPNRDYILDGIGNGFCLTDTNFVPKETFMKNYASASVIGKDAVERNINIELDLGRYIVVDKKPFIVSSIGAVPKPNGDVRIIHDLSRPNGGVNSYSQDNSVAYSTIADATRLIKQGTYLAKIDLKSAYRSVPISSSCYDLTGLHWYFKEDLSPTFLYDCRLPFGASKSCKIFS